MRTKSLLAAAAIVAAGLVSSQAQSNVYSLNIVGYVNVVLQPGYSLIANPLNGGISNGVNEVMAGVPDGTIISSFNAANVPVYDTRTLDGADWVDTGLNVVAPPTLPPGKGFFCFVPTLYTNTFVGTVLQTNSTSLPSGYSLVGSKLAVGGAVTSSPFNLPTPDSCIVSRFNAANVPVYDTRTLDGADWVDTSLNVVATPSIAVGQGFFYFAPTPQTWTQTLP